MKVKQFKSPSDHPRNSSLAKDRNAEDKSEQESRAQESDTILGYIPTSEPSKTDVDSSDVVY